jgi:CRISPR-associated exonuclease Cas4
LEREMTRGSDAADRTRALTDLDATLLVEAAAGTGKTSLLAGRLTMLLASGAPPRNIAAITFTELAAGELRARVTRFVTELLRGVVPPDLEPALPNGLTASQKLSLEESRFRLDELTATTIHGFCHSLLRSYAIEANIDPGADVLDAVQTDLAFRSVFERWLRRRLGENARPADPIAVMARRDPAEAVDTLKKLGKFRREFRSAAPLPSDLDEQAAVAFIESVREFRRWFNSTPKPERAEADVAGLEELAAFYEGAFAPLPSFERLWELAHPKRIDAMRWRSFDLRPYQRLRIWKSAAGKVDGPRLSEEAAAHYERCGDEFRILLGRIATSLVAAFSSELDELLADFEGFKRNAAVLDFNDLLLAARHLLRAHEEVRRAISDRYTRMLIDEFQDTDPVQAEILFLIASEPGEASGWQERRLIPGRFFMVGDPKQAIYRFRGADVASYMDAREAIERQFPGNMLRVTSNFRSRPDILNHVNLCFGERLGKQAPGYVALEATLGGAEHGLPCVSKLTVQVAPESKVEFIREEEARAVAELCAQLVGNIRVRRSNGQVGLLMPGDIALLAPAGTDLWRYERALEEKGLPLVSQAGRSLFRRQETQDLVALIRVLADGRDTLALGALLRGPLVGLTEQELLDIVGALPPDDALSDAPPRLTLATEPEVVNHAIARDVLTVLRDLRRRARGTTPFLVIAEALERLRVRPSLAARSADQAARALANLDLLMERARAYSVRGLTQLARDLEADWEGPEPYDEARLDTSGEAIEIVTVHSSKGLEWPVVIPINTASEFRRRDAFVYRRRDDTMHWVLGDVVPPAIADAIGLDDKESAEERERLLYVACTRAIDLLILPDLSWAAQNSWAQLLDLKQGDLQELNVSAFARRPVLRFGIPANDQTREKFGAEQSVVEAASKPVHWIRPSDTDPDRQPLDAVLYEEVEQIAVDMSGIVGGTARGLVLHKLMEELLTGEVDETALAVESRARLLIDQLGQSASGTAPNASEIAATALRTLALPAVAEVRHGLGPEIAVYSSRDDGEILVAGRADAIACENGQPSVVFDWKSDVAPTDADRLAYKAQLLEYARATGATRGAVVYMSLGQVHWIETR